MEGRSSVFLHGFLLADLLEVLGKGDLESLLVVFIETVLLKGVEGNGRLEDIFKIDEAEQILASAGGSFLYETDALESWERTEDV